MKFRIVMTILLVACIVGGGIFIYSTCAGGKVIQRIDKTKPDVSVAPFQVSTVTRTLYAKRATQNDDDSVTVWEWYERDGTQWIKHEKAFTIPAVLMPKIGTRVE